MPRSSDRTDERRSFQNLIHKYLDKSEELEIKEEKVVKQMELMQYTVASFQGWNPTKSSKTASRQVDIATAQQIDAERAQIQEETKRIHEEVKQKEMENRVLQDMVDRVKREREAAEASVKANFQKAIKKEEERRNAANSAKTDAGSLAPSAPPQNRRDADGYAYDEDDPDLKSDPRLKFFNDKVKRLKEIEQQLKRESEEGSRQARSQREKLMRKIKILEWETDIDRKLINMLKRERLKYASARD